MRNYITMGYFACIAIVTLLLVNGQGNPILFLGPGYGTSGQSEAFTLPTDESPMTKASCTVPTYPLTSIQAAVGFVTPDGLELCGGWAGSDQSACYSLKDSAWTASTPMMVPRNLPAAVRLTSGDILVTGGRSGSRLQSSELLTGTTWTAALELPSGRFGHCLLQLSSGGLYMNGGATASGAARDTYISADLTSWTPRVSSNTARSHHACTEVTINNVQQVWIGGGYNVATSEIYNVAQDGYTTGPNLPNYSYYPGVLVAHVGQVYYAGGRNNKNIYQLKEGWTQQDAWTKIGEMSQTRFWFPALIISLETCQGIKPTPTPLELSYNHDGSVGYVSGTLAPIVTELASGSPESHAVRCCGGVYGNTTTTTCGNGISCTNICGSKNSGCVTVICEECHTSSAEHQVCDKPMQEEQWCANAETIQEITNQCGTLKKKRSLRTSRAAWGITTLIININYCPRKCRNLAALHRMPLCCLHPYVRRAVKGAQKDCCNRHGLCP